MYQEIANRVFPYKNSSIICLETAAIFGGLSNGVCYLDCVKVYSPTDKEMGDLSVIHYPNCFDSKEYEERLGVFCTTEEQTLLDLLEYEEDVDIQTLLEAFSNYYFIHGESFAGLESRMNNRQKEAFERWKEDAINYYTED